jgi:GAF domain-containing protein
MTNDQERGLALALREASRSINSPHSLDATLEMIVEVAANSVPGIDHVGISVAHKDGRLETVAASDRFVNELDELQYKFGEGPCVHAIEADAIVVVPDARHEQRWPRFIREAVARGLRSQLGLRLHADDHTMGALNLYSVSQDDIPDETTSMAEMFAAQAALALGHTLREHGLTEALISRKVIGQALGILMERYHLSEDRAFTFLVRTSSQTNTKLRTVAEQIVSQSGGPR